MKVPGGEAVLEFENEEAPTLYFADKMEAICLNPFKKLDINKPLFAKYKTLQFGDLSGGEVYLHTSDGYTYTYKSDCPIVALWSNEKGGDYICLECWWGINDCPDFPKELSQKPFINFTDEEGKTFSYTLTVNK